MTQATMTTELLVTMKKRAEQIMQNIDQISLNLSTEWQSLRQVVKEYGAKRVNLFKQKLQAREMTWCTHCSDVIPTLETELLLVEGTERYSHGYENSYYGFRGFSKFYRACPACRERAADKHGQQGVYDSQAKDQPSFYAFHVEKREDGYYARKFGNWAKLDEKSCTLDEPPSRLVEKLAEELNLPPKIELESKWSKGKLVIHERVTMAEAR